MMYDEAIANKSYAKRMCDTLIQMLSEKSERTGHIYFLARNITTSFIMVHPNTRTFEQLKSAGALHLIKNANILDSITSYYQSLKIIDEVNGVVLDKINEVHQANNLLFDVSVFQKILGDDFLSRQHGVLHLSEPENNPPFIVKDPLSLNTVGMRYHYLGSVLEEVNGVSAANSEKCNRLISYLKKEYNFENE
jgi:hypothetical protein